MPVDRFGGGSLMVWGGVHYAGKTPLIVIRPSLNAQRYCDDILRPVVVPFMRRNNRFVCQQDNARPHTLDSTMIFLQDNKLTHYLGRVVLLVWLYRIWLRHAKLTNSREASSIQFSAGIGKCAHH
jgi:hypothetical protein